MMPTSFPFHAAVAAAAKKAKPVTLPKVMKAATVKAMMTMRKQGKSRR
jgi:hypothetical protein